MKNLNYSEDYHPITYPVNISMDAEMFSKWKIFLLEDRIKTEKENEKKEKMAKMQADPNFEKYRKDIEDDGHFKFGDQSFEMMFYLHKHLEETPIEELQKEVDEVNKSIGSEGVGVEEYFEGLNPALQRQKGYSEGAESYMKKLEQRLLENESPLIPVSDVIKLMKHIYDNE